MSRHCAKLLYRVLMKWYLPAMLAAPVFAASAEPEPGDAVPPTELAYGVVLYEYFQQRYFDAMVELGAAQQRAQLQNSAGEAELLRGGMSLSYGMERQARSIFDNILAQAGSESHRDRAWFYLGKMDWRRGRIADSASALERIDKDFSGPLADEAYYLRASMALGSGDQRSASALLRAVAEPCPFKPYFFYNLGSWLATQGQWREAGDAFRKVGNLGCDDEEGLALRDKAFTAAGFAALADDNAPAAAGDFTGVRLHGPEADRALLGYGWSLANGEQYRKALAAWQVLSEKAVMSASVRESLLAVPYAFEQLQRPATALELYQQAATRYADQRESLDEAMSLLRDGDLLTLFGLDAVADPQWLGGEEARPAAPYANYLSALLSSDTVQLSLRELYDLRDIQRRLVDARERLAVLRQVDDEQLRKRARVIEGGYAEVLAQQRQGLQREVAALRSRLDAAVENNDARALAAPEQAARWRRVQQAEARARHLGDTEALSRLRVMRGLLQWDDSEAFAERRWSLQQQMRALEGHMRVAQAADEAVRNAVVISARPAFAQRIAALLERVELQEQQLVASLTAAESQLRTVALAQMGYQREQLATVEGQALLAIARLYDSASPEVPR
ncbi:hypothetical protein F0M18_06850 [Pseudohalioglobus sediminis]|uniref:Tetratricopeptide repeat protein n=1 Tax=Pseudohalioglobus sediminis TaxID=2606449 RepID=A0A5B0X2M2_9GAMM|nr:hypothetical protein [Pseudohalioglobus sediminis]KAA1192389.1 hypothetical protein F0M18_06850 [Pseudohalioglobus sediminis]